MMYIYRMTWRIKMYYSEFYNSWSTLSGKYIDIVFYINIIKVLYCAFISRQHAAALFIKFGYVINLNLVIISYYNFQNM